MGQFLLLLLLLFGGKQRVDSIAYKNWIDCVGFSIMNALREFTFLFSAVLTSMYKLFELMNESLTFLFFIFLSFLFKNFFGACEKIWMILGWFCESCCVIVCDDWMTSGSMKERLHTKFFVVRINGLCPQWESPWWLHIILNTYFTMNLMWSLYTRE